MSYPMGDESDAYAIQAHPGGYMIPAAVPNYGTPQHPYGAPYITTSIRGPLRRQFWSTGLCRCLEDPANSCSCEGAIYGALALVGLPCFYSCFYRSKMRAQYELPEAPCMDCFVHFCCEPCALCQEYRELKNRGFDLSIGWEANAGRQGITVPPAVSPSMTR
ncbi:hypothetical protein PIB30_056426 [Stylosanthes scabra]|uniref:POS2 n=1 Tax=Stylosanthes scabra TaxID=79078 RepID=A0ABU6QJ90_9FABA|nr:hypothetical protein [Stylosanthes scabra]